MPHLLSTLAIPPAPAVLDAVYVHTPVLVYVHLPVWPVGGLCDRSLCLLRVYCDNAWLSAPLRDPLVSGGPTRPPPMRGFALTG